MGQTEIFQIAVILLLAVILYRVEKIQENVRAIEARTTPEDDEE